MSFWREITLVTIVGAVAAWASLLLPGVGW